MTQIFIQKIPVILEIHQNKYSECPHFCLLEIKMGAPSGICAYGEHSPSLRRIIEMHLRAPSLIHSMLNSLSQTSTEYETSHTRSKVTRRNGSSGDYRLGISDCTSSEWLRLAIWDREFNTGWIREGACKNISMILLRDGLCSTAWAHLDFQ